MLCMLRLLSFAWIRGCRLVVCTRTCPFHPCFSTLNAQSSSLLLSSHSLVLAFTLIPTPHYHPPHPIPHPGAKYAVAVSVGCHEIRSTFKTYEDGACEWVELAEQINLTLPEMRMMPDMFVTGQYMCPD